MDRTTEAVRFTVVHALADSLQDFDVYCCGAAVIPVILELFVADNSVLPFLGCKSERCSPGDSWNDGAGIERQYRGVCVDIVRVEDFGEVKGWEEGFGEFTERGKGVFVWTVVCFSLEKVILEDSYHRSPCVSACLG